MTKYDKELQSNTKEYEEAQEDKRSAADREPPEPRPDEPGAKQDEQREE